MKNQYVLEWSHKTNNFHIQPLEQLLERNQDRFIDNTEPPNWAVLFMGSLDAVTEMSDHWRVRLKVTVTTSLGAAQ